MSVNTNTFASVSTPQESGFLPAYGKGKTILVDCNGTMFDCAHQKGLNKPLLDFLIEAQNRGYKVQLHSISADGNASYINLFTTFNSKFKTFIENCEDPDFPIVSKVHTNTKEAFLTIDDEHKNGFVSEATHQWSPNDLRMARTMKEWSNANVSVPSAYVIASRNLSNNSHP